MPIRSNDTAEREDSNDRSSAHHRPEKAPKLDGAPKNNSSEDLVVYSPAVIEEDIEPPGHCSMIRNNSSVSSNSYKPPILSHEAATSPKVYGGLDREYHLSNHSPSCTPSINPGANFCCQVFSGAYRHAIGDDKNHQFAVQGREIDKTIATRLSQSKTLRPRRQRGQADMDMQQSTYVHEKTLCGSEMWVASETGAIDWQIVDWDPAPLKVRLYFTQGYVAVEDSRSQTENFAKVPLTIGNNDLLGSDYTRMKRNSEPSGNEWEEMARLAPVNSKSVPGRMRERALNKRNDRRRTTIGLVTQGIRNLFGRGIQGEDSKNPRRSLLDIPFKLWKKNNSNSSDVHVVVDDSHQLVHIAWDRIGPRNEHLIYSSRGLVLCRCNISSKEKRC